MVSLIRARETYYDYDNEIDSSADEREGIISPRYDWRPIIDFIPRQSSSARKPSSGIDSTSVPVEAARRKSPLEDFTVSSGAAEPIVTCVPGYIIEVSDTHVLCWVKVAPEYRVKISIEKGSFGDIKLVSGVRFDWSPSLRTVQPAIREKELEDDIAALEASL